MEREFVVTVWSVLSAKEIKAIHIHKRLTEVEKKTNKKDKQEPTDETLPRNKLTNQSSSFPKDESYRRRPRQR